tara:strand:+ start:4033 stop:5115 length:1083 start_codon:yes stop_codon:yes gene_type:complete
MSQFSAIKNNILLRALTRPQDMPKFSPAQWNACLFLAHLHSLSGRLAADAEKTEIWSLLPPKVQDLLTSAKLVSEACQRQIVWEVNRIQRALFDDGGDILLLKGVAYIKCGLQAARGRLSADIDILVARDRLETVEKMLLDAGWVHHVTDEYDQKYYRQWAHELPPLRHPDRGVSTDVHHTILPLTSRLAPDISRMWAASSEIEPGLRVFAPEDMVLHSSVHLFHDGEIAGALRNLLEQHDMLTEFGTMPGFWERLTSRAEQLGLSRPLYYTLRYCARLLDTRIPEQAFEALQGAEPPPVLRRFMDVAVPEALLAPRKGLLCWLSCKLLYLRAHALRMPPLLLSRHLATKTLRRLKGQEH